jgi:hypothetical protein
MVVIRNKLNQRLIINLKGGKNIGLLAKGAVEVSDEEFSSSHLQTLLEKGNIIVSHKAKIPAEKEQAETEEYIEPEENIETEEQSETKEQSGIDEENERKEF